MLHPFAHTLPFTKLAFSSRLPQSMGRPWLIGPLAGLKWSLDVSTLGEKLIRVYQFPIKKAYQLTNFPVVH